MIDFIIHSQYFGFAITLVFFGLAWLLQKKSGIALLNPIVLSAVAIILVLTLCDIDYSSYQKGGVIISFFLTPATICYAVPLYKQIKVLKKNAFALTVGICSGCLAHAASIFMFSLLFKYGHVLYTSLLPKSITVTMSMPLSEKLGGDPALTVGVTIMAGITGALFAPFFCKLFRITEPVAAGIAIGTASHAIGTTRAFELGEVQGTMSSLSIVINGLLTVVVVPYLNFI